MYIVYIILYCLCICSDVLIVLYLLLWWPHLPSGILKLFSFVLCGRFYANVDVWVVCMFIVSVWCSVGLPLVLVWLGLGALLLVAVWSPFMWSGMMLQFILRGLDCLSQNLKQSIYMLFRYFSQNQRGAEISWQTDRVILLQAWNVKDSPVLTFTDLFLCCVLMIIDWVSFGFRQTRLLRVCCSHHIVTIFWYFIKDQSIMAENFRY